MLPSSEKPVVAEVDDGRATMLKIFVESKAITSGDFEICWPRPSAGVGKLLDPFIQNLADRGTFPIEKSLLLLTEKSQLGYVPLDKYDVDYELARSFSPNLCRRWCVLPFDKMSKTVLVATANPFNRQAAKELEGATPGRFLWYLTPPQDLIRALKKAFR